MPAMSAGMAPGSEIVDLLVTPDAAIVATADGLLRSIRAKVD